MKRSLRRGCNRASTSRCRRRRCALNEAQPPERLQRSVLTRLPPSNPSLNEAQPPERLQQLGGDVLDIVQPPSMKRSLRRGCNDAP